MGQSGLFWNPTPKSCRNRSEIVTFWPRTPIGRWGTPQLPHFLRFLGQFFPIYFTSIFRGGPLFLGFGGFLRGFGGVLQAYSRSKRLFGGAKNTTFWPLLTLFGDTVSSRHPCVFVFEFWTPFWTLLDPLFGPRTPLFRTLPNQLFRPPKWPLLTQIWRFWLDFDEFYEKSDDF